MATVPEDLTVALIQGQSYLYVFERVNNVQVITLVGGPSVGTWWIHAYGLNSGNLVYNASAGEVQTALQLIPLIGANGVTVTRSGSGTSGTPYKYTLTWAEDLAATLQPLVEVGTNFTPVQPASVAYQPFDFTGWTMTMTVAPRNADQSFGTTIVQITESSTVSNPGRIYIGYVPPAAEGGTPGTNDPTNGMVALLISAAKTASLTPSQFNNTDGRAAGVHQVIGANSGATWKKTFYDGPATFKTEPS